MRVGSRSRSRWAVAGALVTVVAAIMGSGAPVAAALPSVTFGLRIGSCTISGEAPPNLLMRLVHQDASGTRLGSTTVQVEADGDWSVPCLPGGAIQSRHRIVALDGSTRLRTLVVPTLSIDLDRATDHLRLRGPAGVSLRFVLDSCFPGNITCNGGTADLLLQPDDTGRFEATLDPDARGGDRVRLEWDDPVTTDFFERLQSVPYLQVERGSPKVTGGARPNTTVHLVLKRSGVVRGTGSDMADADGGAWSTRFRRHGAQVTVKTGDRVKGDYASDGSLDVMTTRVTVDLAADTAHIRCYPHGRYGFIFSQPGTSTDRRGFGELDQTGTTDITALSMVESGWVTRLWCATRRGDVVYRKATVP